MLNCVLYSFYWCRFHYCLCHHYYADDATRTTKTPYNEKDFHFRSVLLFFVVLFPFISFDHICIIIPITPATVTKNCKNFVFEQVTHWQHPRFHAYFPSGNSFPSILGDMLSDGIGAIGFSWVSAIQYYHNVCRYAATIYMRFSFHFFNDTHKPHSHHFFTASLHWNQIATVLRNEEKFAFNWENWERNLVGIPE